MRNNREDRKRTSETMHLSGTRHSALQHLSSSIYWLTLCWYVHLSGALITGLNDIDTSVFHRLESSPGHRRTVCSILDHPLCVATPLLLVPRHLIDAHLPPGAGTVQLVEAGLPHRNYFSGTAHKLGVLYTTSVIILEVITTTLIAARILQLGRWNRLAAASALPHNKMSRKAAAYPYTGAVAIIVESALPSTLSGVAYLVSYALGSDLSILFLSIYVMLSVRELIGMRSGRHRWTDVPPCFVAVHLAATDHTPCRVRQSMDAPDDGDPFERRIHRPHPPSGNLLLCVQR